MGYKIIEGSNPPFKSYLKKMLQKRRKSLDLHAIQLPRHDDEEIRDSERKWQEETLVKGYLQNNPHAIDRHIRENVNTSIVFDYIFSLPRNSTKAQDHVTKFLSASPLFLDEFVQKRVEKQKVKKWLKIKRIMEGSLKSSFEEFPISGKEEIISCDPMMLLKKNKEVQIFLSLASVLRKMTTADSFAVFMESEYLSKTLTMVRPSDLSGKHMPIVQGDTLAGEVALTKEVIYLPDVKASEIKRFKKPFGFLDGSKVTSVLCVPVLPAARSIAGVIELRKHQNNPPFDENVVENVKFLCGCLSSLIQRNEEYRGMKAELLMKDRLQDFCSQLFSGLHDFNVVTEVFLSYTSSLVGAERSTLYYFDSEEDELISEMYFTEGEIRKYRSVRKFSIAGKVYETLAFVCHEKKTIRINRCGPDIEHGLGKKIEDDYISRNIACLPITIPEECRPFGALLLINKISDVSFTETDIEKLEKLLSYCGTTLKHSLKFTNRKIAREHMEISSTMLYYPFPSEADKVKRLLDEESIPSQDNYDIESHLFPYRNCNPSDVPRIFLRMANAMFGKHGFPVPEIHNFLETINANYFGVKYHNILHALCFAQSMYWMLRKNPDIFSPLEKKALIVAGLCHDLGHPGSTDSFLRQVHDCFINMYTNPLLEQHHTQLTFMVLMKKENNIFGNLSGGDYRQTLNDIEMAILSTQFQRYNLQMGKVSSLLQTNSFCLEDQGSKDALKALMMMTCDLSASWKSWEVHKTSVRDLYTEFFELSDKEKSLNLKSQIHMMRENAKSIPQSQIVFLENIPLPIFRLLVRVLPNLSEIIDATVSNLEKWRTVEGEEWGEIMLQ